MDNVLYQAFIYLAAAVIAVPLARRLGFGSVLGYLVAGLIIGPVMGLVGAETAELQHFAEFGVVLMLFVIGLELEPRALWAMRHQLIGLGGAQILLTTLVLAVIAWTQDIPISVSVAIGITLALSSTAIVMQTLDEKQLARSDGGRSAFFVLLMQDIAVIPVLALLPLLAIPGLAIMAALTGEGEVAHPTETQVWIAKQSPFIASSIVLGAVAVVGVVGVFLVTPLFRYISHSKMREIFIAAALLLVIGTALLMSTVGLSPALGTFMAGVLLANSAYRHELEADIEPFKGLLLGLFFITVGAGINTLLLWDKLWVILSMTIGLMALKFAILWLVGWVFGLRGRTQLLFALSLAQAGEFGFVLLGFATQSHVMTRPLAELLGLVVALSMFLTPLLFILFDRLGSRITTPEAADDTPIVAGGKVIIAGLGRFGQVVNRLMLLNGHPTTVIDGNAETVHRMRMMGIKAFLGDVTRPEVMIAAGITEARAVVVAIDDADKAVKIVEYITKAHPHVHVVARAKSRHDVYRLYAAGARDIVRETFDSSVRAGKYALRALGAHPYDAERAGDQFVIDDRRMIREMAQDWDPRLQAHENPPLLARIREQNLRIERVLRGEAEPRTTETRSPDAQDKA